MTTCEACGGTGKINDSGLIGSRCMMCQGTGDPDWKRGKAQPQDGFMSLVERIMKLEGRVFTLEDKLKKHF